LRSCGRPGEASLVENQRQAEGWLLVLKAAVAAEDGLAAKVRGGLLDDDAVRFLVATPLIEGHVPPGGCRSRAPEGKPGTASVRFTASICQWSILTSEGSDAVTINLIWR
jgi:hypothetical protein